MKNILITVGLLLFSFSAMAENRTYGQVWLTGLARNSWHLNSPGLENAMVCNVNGPDGFLTIRACADTSCASERKLERLAIVVVDTSQRYGRWVRVVDAYRSVDKYGRPLSKVKNLTVQGWAHDGYLCDFIFQF